MMGFLPIILPMLIAGVVFRIVYRDAPKSIELIDNAVKLTVVVFG